MGFADGAKRQDSISPMLTSVIAVQRGGRTLDPNDDDQDRLAERIGERHRGPQELRFLLCCPRDERLELGRLPLAGVDERPLDRRRRSPPCERPESRTLKRWDQDASPRCTAVQYAAQR
jgi:hypothetical protein